MKNYSKQACINAILFHLYHGDSEEFWDEGTRISDLDREMEFYMNKNAIDKKEAQQLLSLGFIQPFTNELPLEYAIELKRLLKQII